MKPVVFECVAILPHSPEAIAEQLLDMQRWSEFAGYGPLPGIKSAEFETRTPEVVGSRVRVIDSHGGTHIEEFVEWRPGERIQLDMKEFGPPLSRLATKIEEVWLFERVAEGTRATRAFQMHPRSAFTRPLVWLISFLLKNAISRHLREMRG